MGAFQTPKVHWKQGVDAEGYNLTSISILLRSLKKPKGENMCIPSRSTAKTKYLCMVSRNCNKSNLIPKDEKARVRYIR